MSTYIYPGILHLYKRIKKMRRIKLLEKKGKAKLRFKNQD